MTTKFGSGVKRVDASTTVVEAWGELDVATAPELERHVDVAFSGSAPAVVLDLRRVRFADSSAANTLGVVSCRAVVEGRTLTVRPSSCLRRVLLLTGTARLLTLEEDAHAIT